MKKKIICFLLALMFAFSIVFVSNAATFVQKGNQKVPVTISYKDIKRLAEVATTVRGKKATIVNAQKHNGSESLWVARLVFEEGGDRCSGDFVINLYPYECDLNTKEVVSLPFKNVTEGTAIFGPCWYYFGLFDDKSNEICGFAVAERIKRWPGWNDLMYFGQSFRKTLYDGKYIEANDVDFIDNHIKGASNK